jgi:hypothetical protein
MNRALKILSILERAGPRVTGSFFTGKNETHEVFINPNAEERAGIIADSGGMIRWLLDASTKQAYAWNGKKLTHTEVAKHVYGGRRGPQKLLKPDINLLSLVQRGGNAIFLGDSVEFAFHTLSNDMREGRLPPRNKFWKDFMK